MDQNLEKRIADMEAKVDAIYVSVEKTRKYITWTAIVTLALFILPLIGLMFAIPSFISTYNSALELGI